MQLDPVTRQDIERDGLDRPQGQPGTRTAAEQRHAEYMAHCKRMETDQEYRLRWEQREKEFEEAKARHYYY